MAGVAQVSLGQLVKSAGEFTISNLTCDNLTGIGLQAISFLAQTEMLILQSQLKMAKNLRSDFGDQLSDITKQFKDGFSEKLDSASTDQFDRWLMKQFEDNFNAGKDDPLGLVGSTQLVNDDGFSPVLAGDLTANQYGDNGSRQDFSDPTCEASSGTGFSSTFTGAAGAALDLTKTAGRLAGLAGAIVHNPSMLLYGMMGALDTITELMADGDVLLQNLVDNAEQILLMFKDVRKEDYEQDERLSVFLTLLRSAISDAESAERAVKQGDKKPAAAEDLKDALDKAVAWAASLRGTRLSVVAQKVTGYLTLYEQQINLYEQLSTKFVRVNTNFTQGVPTMTAQTRFDPFFVNVYTQVKCTLSKLWAEVLRTSKNASLALIMKQLEWAASLKAMQVLVNSYSPQKLATDLSAELASGTGLDLATTATDFDQLNQQFSPATLAVEVLDASRAFLTAAKTALKSYVDYGALSALVDTMKAKIALMRQAQDAFFDRVAEFAGNNAEELEASRSFFRVMNTVKPFIPLMLALQEADYSNFFSTDILTSSIETLRLRLLAKAAECCEESLAKDANPSPQSQAGLTRIEQQKNAAGGDEKLAAFDRRYNDDVSSNAVKEIQQRIQKAKAGIKQFEQLFKLPCLGGPEFAQRFF